MSHKSPKRSWNHIAKAHWVPDDDTHIPEMKEHWDAHIVLYFHLQVISESKWCRHSQAAGGERHLIYDVQTENDTQLTCQYLTITESDHLVHGVTPDIWFRMYFLNMKRMKDECGINPKLWAHKGNIKLIDFFALLFTMATPFFVFTSVNLQSCTFMCEELHIHAVNSQE